MDEANRTGFLQRRGDWLLAALLMLATAALFRPAAGFSYINLDDYPYVAANPMVAGGLTWDGIRAAFTTVHEFWWLPLLWISYMLDISLFGPGPHGHHVMNILLHAVNAGLLFGVLRRLTGSRWRSLFAAALFAWHPLRVESVAWLAARKDVLSGLFFLLSLWAYARHAERPSMRRMAVVAGWMLAGVMSKAILIVLPAWLLALDFWPLRRARQPAGAVAWAGWRPLVAEKWLLFLLAAVFTGLNLFTHRVDATAGGGELLWTRLGLIAPNYWTYLRLFVWPTGLSILHPDAAAVSWGRTGLALSGLAAVTALAWSRRNRAPYAWTGWVWFGAALLPVIRGVRMGLAGYADRFLYLPSIGLGLAVVWGAAALARRRGAGTVAVLTGCGVLAAAAWGTARYLPAWRDSGAVFGHARQTPPVHPLAILNHGVWQMGAGRLDEAEQTFKAFLESAPGEPRGLGGLGRVRVLQGRTEEAREVLAPAVAQDKPVWSVAEAWGMTLLHEGKAAEALSVIEQALAQHPGEASLRVNALRAARQAGDREAAARQTTWLRAAGAESADAALWAYHADLWRQGGRRYAWRYFEQALARDPDQISLLNNAAWLAATDRDTPPEIAARAREWAERAVDLTGGVNATALDTLGAARAAGGDYPDAVAAAERALTLATARGDAAQAAGIRARLDLYRSGAPFRE